MISTELDVIGDRQNSFSTFSIGQNDPTNRHSTVSSNRSTVSYTYDMNFANRGIAVIFNHYKIKNQEKRRGTAVDCKILSKTLESLSFEVLIENDLSLKGIEKKLNEVAKMDHSNNACLVVIVMTHGEDQDDLFASDGKTYSTDTLWDPFFGNKCPSLVGKPKLFFIQACRGKQVDEGAVNYCLDAEGDQPITVIPTMADILVMFSSCETYVSWRHAKKGSWFIQSLCAELNENGEKLHLLEMLVRVTRRVAYIYESKRPKNKIFDKKKQCPVVVSMLTKMLYLT